MALIDAAASAATTDDGVRARPIFSSLVPVAAVLPGRPAPLPSPDPAPPPEPAAPSSSLLSSSSLAASELSELFRLDEAANAVQELKVVGWHHVFPAGRPLWTATDATVRYGRGRLQLRQAELVRLLQTPSPQPGSSSRAPPRPPRRPALVLQPGETRLVLDTNALVDGIDVVERVLTARQLHVIVPLIGA